MKETIINLIENESENTKLDFKLEQYPIGKSDVKKGEFLKDMCAFANLASKDDKFIIIGVEEKNGVSVGFKPIDQLHDQASYQQFLNENIEPEINFEYKEIIHQENRLAYFRLFENNKRPYLFKKEYKDNLPKGIHYRVGTGFVRTGTSTRELKRDDFEKIYDQRFETHDRSNDIEFNLKIGRFRSSELNTGYYKHLQVDVTNLSNTSIDLDVEARVYNTKIISAKCAQDLEHKVYTKRREKSMWAYTAHLDKMMPPHVFMDMGVDYKNHGKYSSYDIRPKKGTHTTIRVKQKGSESDIFNGQIALVFSRPAEIKIELIVRSNDFPNGPKTFSYHLSEEDTRGLFDPFDF